ncbi:hypothetical protein VUR80DRAFT_8591 [Thermomyces stellatus]
MAAIDSKIVAREFAHLMKRDGNFASKHPGVILVFCICFIVGVFLVGLFIYKKLQKRKQAKSHLVV